MLTQNGPRKRLTTFRMPPPLCAQRPTMRAVRNTLLSGLIACASCTGSIDAPRDIPRSPDGVPITGPADDPIMRAEDPAAFDTASQYFPGAAAGAGNKRLFRLTRDQIDLTTQ